MSEFGKNTLMKKLLSLVIAIILLSGLYSPFVFADSSGSEGWIKEYTKILDNWTKNHSYSNQMWHYVVRDLNGDGIPELFISGYNKSNRNTYDNYQYVIWAMYTYDGRYSYSLWMHGVNPEYTIRKNNIICRIDGEDGFINMDFMKLEKGKTYLTKVTGYEYYSGVLEGVPPSYAKDGKKINKSEWDKAGTRYPLDWDVPWWNINDRSQLMATQTQPSTPTKPSTPAYTYNITGMTDVPDTKYYAQPIKWGLDKGITNGIGGKKFGPENPCTRGQVVTFLWRVAGSPEPRNLANPFKDVSVGAYYGKAVLWAVERGITTGTSYNTFSPDSTCTRGQVASFLWRWKGSPKPSFGTSFSDVSRSQYYFDAVSWAVAKDITKGTSGTQFSPNKTCSRGEIITFLYRASKVKEEIPALKVVIEPSDRSVAAGERVSLSVTIEGGTPPYSYQWREYRNGSWSNVDGAGMVTSQASHSITIQPFENAQYCCIIEDSSDQRKRITTRIVTVTFLPPAVPLTVESQSRGRTVNENEEASLWVMIKGGTAPYTYRWQKESNGVWETEKTFYGIESQTNTYTFFPKKSGVYRCIVSDSDSVQQMVITDEVMVNVKENPQPAEEPLSIVLKPTKQTIQDGETAVLKAETAGGIQPYFYRWYVLTDGAWRYLSYNDKELRISDAGTYACRVVDAGGNSVFSDEATVEVRQSPADPLFVLKQPEDVTIYSGQMAYVYVNMTGGTAPYHFQWQKKEGSSWVDIEGETSGMYSNIWYQNETVRCVVTDSSAPAQSITSETAAIRMAAPFKIISQPRSVTTGAGEWVELSVTVSGGISPYKYQWQEFSNRNGWVDCRSATNFTRTHTYRVTASSQKRTFRCIITEGSSRKYSVTTDEVAVSPPDYTADGTD